MTLDDRPIEEHAFSEDNNDVYEEAFERLEAEELNKYNGNGRKGKKGKRKDQSTAKEYSVYKYTKKDGLVEQIQLAGHSKFLQVINGKPILSDKIEQADKGLVLKPQLVIGSSPPVIQYQYNDIKEIEYFIDLVSDMHIDDLYFLVKSIWNDCIATENKHLISLLSADTIASYFQEMFITTHYVLLTGPPGWGKGVILLTFKLLGYRVILAGDMSGANLLDLIGPIEKCQISIAEDELDNIHDDPDKERIYKMGYEDIGLVTRTVDPSSSDRAIRLYNPYCIKFFASERGPDSKELGGFNDRTFRSEVRKGRPRYLVKEIKKQMERSPENQLPKYRTIIDRINFLRKSLLIYKLIHSNDTIEEIETNIDGRALELCGPTLRLFNSDILASEDKKALSEVRDALSHFLRKKGELDEKTIQSVIYRVLTNIFNTMDSGTADSSCCKMENIKDVQGNDRVLYNITYEKICRSVMEDVGGNMISMRTFESDDFPEITHDALLNECRTVFGAKDANPIGSDRDKKKALMFNKQEAERAGRNFSVVSEIKIFDKTDRDDKQSPEDYRVTSMWNEWTNGKAGTNILISSQYPHIEHNNTSKFPENKRENDVKDSISRDTVHGVNDKKLVSKFPDGNSDSPSISSEKTYTCEICKIRGSIWSFSNEKQLITHGVNSHPRQNIRNEADIEKFRAEWEAKHSKH